MSLGFYCARAGDETCALEEGSRAESMQPENLEMLFHNAVILAILGKPDPALDKLEKAVKLGLTRAGIRERSRPRPVSRPSPLSQDSPSGRMTR